MSGTSPPSAPGAARDDSPVMISASDAAPEATSSSSSSSSTSSTSSSASKASEAKSRPPPLVSTIADAGKHNRYIWTKELGYWRSHVAAAGGGRPLLNPPQPLSRRSPLPAHVFWLRAVALSLWLVGTAATVVLLVLLPIALAGWACVLLSIAKDKRLTPWPRWCLRLCSVITGVWMAHVGAVMEVVMGMRVVLAGSLVQPEKIGEGALVLSNHPTTADWLYLFSFFARQGDISKMKICLKSALHRTPVLGWALQTVAYLFMARDWEKDKIQMERMVRLWSGCNANGADAPPEKVQLLFFPEGTDLTPDRYDFSYAFAQREGRPHLQHTLQPRTTGFVHVLKLMRAQGLLDAVYDVTIGSVPCPLPFPNLLHGVVPDEVHFYVRRWEISEVPTDDAALASWLQARWLEKDALLEGFYSRKPPRFDAAEDTTTQLPGIESSARARNIRLLGMWGAGMLAHLLFVILPCPLVMLALHALAVAAFVLVIKKLNGFDCLMLEVDTAFERARGKATNRAEAARAVGTILADATKDSAIVGDEASRSNTTAPPTSASPRSSQPSSSLKKRSKRAE